MLALDSLSLFRRSPLSLFLTSAALAGLMSPAGRAAGAPVLAAPGARDRALVVASACPTFSWGAVPAAREVELVVYAIADRTMGEAVLRERLPAGTTAWTPSLDRCLQPGRYAWTVGLLNDEGEEEWAEQRLFAVRPDGSEELRRLIDEAIERYARAQTTMESPAPPGPESAVPSDPALGRGIKQRSDAVVVCGTAFNDVPDTNPFCPWIELSAADGITEECASGRYCPSNTVTREQLAMLLGKVHHAAAGGDLNGNYPNPQLAPAFRLPESCGTNQLVRWAGTEWECTDCMHDADCPGADECNLRACTDFSCLASFVEQGGPCQDFQGECDGAGKCICYGFVNETGVPSEADYCFLRQPSSPTVQAGQFVFLFGDVHEQGVTEFPGCAATVVARLGLGPVGSSPINVCGWTWSVGNCAYSDGTFDGYAFPLQAPTPGTFAFTVEISVDNGWTWTACDLDGAGSTTGYDFSANQLGTLTVTP